MISHELADGSLIQFSDVEVSGPAGYWLDIVNDRQGLAKVIHFTDWLRKQRWLFLNQSEGCILRGTYSLTDTLSCILAASRKTIRL
ncbi:hypothetical protein [Aliamphritea spongicola]|nr:hypothetical protein [Aliamphritea spongicola]